MSEWCVYRMYDASAALLYIGHTGNLTNRLRCHRRDKPWWHEVEHVFHEPCDDKDQAMRTERDAICAERPRYNVQLARPQQVGFSLRIPEDVRDAALARCKREGVTFSDVMRSIVTEYVGEAP